MERKGILTFSEVGPRASAAVKLELRSLRARWNTAQADADPLGERSPYNLSFLVSHRVLRTQGIHTRDTRGDPAEETTLDMSSQRAGDDANRNVEEERFLNSQK